MFTKWKETRHKVKQNSIVLRIGGGVKYAKIRKQNIANIIIYKSNNKKHNKRRKQNEMFSCIV